ncbi:Tigger transposable element-derived protein 1, partial [Lunasporangiospora selenospora]
ISHLQVQPAQPESGPTITIAQEQPELRLEQPEVDPALGIPDPDGEPEGGPAVPARREKRARTAVTLQRKLEIIKYVERNRIHSTWKKMGEELQINRSTMQNIFKDKENIQKLSLLANEISPPFTMESSRLAQSNFYQMEVLLIKWAADMRAHQVPIPLVTIRWQAYAVHRLLSGLGAETLPPHKFCGEWFRKFALREDLREADHNNTVVPNNASPDLLRFRQLFDRILRNRLGQQRVELSDWLIAFDSELENSSLLLVSVVVWEQIKGMLQGLKLTNLRVEAVPVQLNKWLPMRTGIVREFKCYVNALNFEWTRDRSYPLGNVYQQAMQNVQGTVIQKCHQQFREVVQGTKPGKLFKGLTPGQRRLDQVLRVVHNVNDGSNDDVFQYYLNQDCDVGPSAFLGAEIEKMITNSTHAVLGCDINVGWHYAS